MTIVTSRKIILHWPLIKICFYICAQKQETDMNKPRVIKDFDKLDEAIQDRIIQNYPDGFEKHLVKFTNAEGKNVSALPFETEDKYYLVRMTLKEARQLDDELDFDPDSVAADIKDEFVEKYDSGESDEEKDFADDDDTDDFDDEEDEKDDDY